MTSERREQMVTTLILWTGWSRKAFENKSDKEIIELYERHIRM